MRYRPCSASPKHTARLLRFKTCFYSILLLTALLLTSTNSLGQNGTTYYVRTNGSDAGNGTAWNTAFLTLQKALATAQSGDQIWVAAGTYYPDEGLGQTNNARTSSFSMKNGVNILGGFPATGTPTLADRNPASNPTILSGDLDKNNTLDDNSTYHVVSNGNGLTNTAVLDGFVITGGNATGSDDNAIGGGVLNNGYRSVCSPSFRNCTFQGNNAANGGAMYNRGIGGTSSPTLTNCSFQNNSATNGGAMYNDGSYNGTSSPTLTNCSFHHNSAYSGGAMCNAGYNGTSSPTLINCVLSGNGGAKTFSNNYSSVSATYSLFEPGTIDVITGTNLVGDPQFVDAANGNLRLQPTSRAINAGDPNTTTASAGAADLAGNPRIVCLIDMGAYEFQYNPILNQPTPYPNTANNALNFDGNDFVSVRFTDVLNCAALTPALTTALTIEYWFKGTNLQSAVRFQNSSDYVSAGWGTPGQQKHILSNDGGAANGLAVGAAATDGTWHHIAMTWQQNTTDGFRSYLDGVLVEKRNSADVALPAISNLYLGSFSGIAEFMNGALDEVRVWNVARTQAQIQQSLTGCQSPIGQPGLVLYYAFDQGVANGDNPGQKRLLNKVNPDQYPGTLSNFTLGSSTSNWVAGAPLNPTPTATIIFPNSVTVAGSLVPVVRVPSLTPPVVFQASGGTDYQRTIVLDRINGFEIRQSDSNTTGIFPINRLGLFTLTVTGTGGCSRTVQWTVEQQ